MSKSTKATKSPEWRKAETRVQSWLNRRGVRTRHSKRGPYDLITMNGVRIEVKHCPFKRFKHANNRFLESEHIDINSYETQVDFYVSIRT